MKQLIVEAENSGYLDGYELRYDPTIDLYTIVHGNALAYVARNNSTVYVGQQFDFWGYNYYLFAIDRGGLVFDTSALPDGARIISAVLSLFGRSDLSYTDFDITLVSGEDLADAFVDADYGELLARVTPMGTLLNSSTYSADYNNEITLNALGIAAISKTGNTRFALRSSRDISATNPQPSPPLSVERLRPDATGDEANLDAHPGTGEDNYEDVDEVTSDEDATYVSVTNSVHWLTYTRDLYAIANHSVGSETIYAVRVHAVCKYVGGVGYARLYVKSGGTIDYANTKHVLDPSYTEEVQEWEENPDTSNPWTWAEVDSLQAGIALNNTDGTARCTQLWVEVLYGPSGYVNYNYEYVGYYGSNTAGKKPKLTINYTERSGNPNIDQVMYQHVERMGR